MEFKKFEKNNRKVEIGVESYTLGNTSNPIYTVTAKLNKEIPVENQTNELNRYFGQNATWRMPATERLKFDTEKAELMERIGRNLRDARIRQGKTQADLYASTRIFPNDISAFEHGYKYVSLDRLQRLANALNTTIEELAGIKPAKVTSTIQLYRGNDLDKALLFSKLYLNSTLEATDFVEQSRTMMNALDSLMLVEKISAILAS